MTRARTRSRSRRAIGGRATGRKGGMSRGRRAALAAAVVATAGLTAIGVAGAGRQQPAPTALEQQLQDEIDAMVAAGLPEDDPKVQLLEDQVEDLRRGRGIRPPKEPGVDLGDLVADARAADNASRRAAERAAAGADDADGQAGTAQAGTAEAVAGAPETSASGWPSGPVECEPVPGVLTAEDVAGATCASVAQPDGSSRYVAVGGDGTVRAVAFGADGSVRRHADRPVPGGVTAGATSVTPTAEGDIQVQSRGKAPVTVDLG
jgi:hypothetical protein